ncbi:unnamed protein product [Prunus armeniaca]
MGVITAFGMAGEGWPSTSSSRTCSVSQSPSAPITVDGYRRTVSRLPSVATLLAGCRLLKSHGGISGCFFRVTGSRLRDSLSDFQFPQHSK